MIEQVDYAAIKLMKTAVYRQMGYEVGKPASPKVEQIVNRRLSQAETLVKPSYSLVMRNVKQVNDLSVTIAGNVTFQSEVLGHLLRHSKDVAVFALTIGPEIEALARQLTNEGAGVDAFVVDAIGTCAVQKLVVYLQKRVAAWAVGQGLGVSKRFCPGYCDWSVAEQKGLFELLQDEVPGITLTEHCLMLPHKSMSGLIGIGEAGLQVRNYVPCRNCQMRDCIGRR